jgi:hypothetical protein
MVRKSYGSGRGATTGDRSGFKPLIFLVAVDRNHGELTPYLSFEIKGFAAA